MPPRWFDWVAKLVLVIGAGVAAAACGDSDGAGVDTDTSTGATGSGSTAPSCDVGALGCVCTNGGGCDAGLVCEAGVCVAGDGATSSGSATGPGLDDTSEGTGVTGDTGTTGGSSSGTDGSGLDLDGWTRRREIVIDNPNAALEDFQVLVDLPWDDDFAPTLADLRFTDDSGTQLLAHHVESFVAPVDAQVWVRVPALAGAGSTVVHLYYGNPAAESVDDPEATFLFWEPFDGAALDPTRWLAVGDNTVSGGTLTITTGSVYSVTPIVDAPGVVAETRLRAIERAPASTPPTSGLAFSSAQAQMAPSAFIAPISGGYQVTDGDMNQSGNLPGFSGLPTNTYVRAGLAMAAGATAYFIDGVLPPVSQTSTLWFDADFYLLLGSIQGAAGASSDIWDTEHEWVRTRRFALAEVTASVGDEERL